MFTLVLMLTIALAPERQQDDVIPINLTKQDAMKYLNHSKKAVEKLTAEELRRFVKEVDDKEKSTNDLRRKPFERQRESCHWSNWPEFELVFEPQLKQEYIRTTKLHERLHFNNFPIHVTNNIRAFLHSDMRSMKLEINLPPCLQVCTGWKKVCEMFKEKISYFQAESFANQIFEKHQEMFGCGPLDSNIQHVSLNTKIMKLNNSAIIKNILEQKFEGYLVKFKEVNMHRVGIHDQFRFEVQIKKPESMIQTFKRTIEVSRPFLLLFISLILYGYVVKSHVLGAFNS